MVPGIETTSRNRALGGVAIEVRARFGMKEAELES